MPSLEVLRDAITAALSPVHLEVTDISGTCGTSFNLIVVSDKFEGLALLERHRLVNQSVSEFKDIHALTMKTWTKAQYDEKFGVKPAPQATE
jgi:stress-induced morphogen